MMESKCFFLGIPSLSSTAVSKQFMELGNVLAKRGHHVIILISGQGKEKERHGTNPAIYTWPSPRPVKFRDAWFLWKMIRKFKPDCLIANFAAVNIMMLVGWMAGVSQRISWYHSIIPSQVGKINIGTIVYLFKQYYLLVRKLLVYKLATYIVAVSRSARNDVITSYKVPLKKTKVFYNLLYDPEYICDHINTDTRVNKVLYVAGLYLFKGQDILINALSILKKDFSDICVEFVGDGPAKEYYLQMISTLRLEDNCVFTGALPHAEVINRMASAYMTVLSSRSEAFGFVLIESMAVGTPVVASAVGGIPEIIRDGKDGFLVPSDDPSSLAEKIGLLLSDRSLRNIMGKNARKQYLLNFEINSAITKQVRWFEAILNLKL